MTMEPDDPDARLTPVTAQTHGPDRAHETHDRLLVARFALGDALAGDEAAAVRALLATCSGCTDLVAEMQLVQHATATSRVPARPRDFFLTAEQADTLRPGAWQRLLARFSSPRLTVLRPLAGATLAMGIVLVGAGAVLPDVDSDAPAPEANGTTMMMAGSPDPDATAAPFIVMQPAESPFAAQFDPNSRDGNPKASPLAGTEVFAGASAQPEMVQAPEGSPDLTAVRLASPEPRGDTVAQDASITAVASQDDPLSVILLVTGIVVAAISAALLVLAWLARRDTDPLLR
jgi:hypothetical protein